MAGPPHPLRDRRWLCGNRIKSGNRSSKFSISTLDRMKGKYFRILCLIAGCGAFLFLLPATIIARDRGPYDAGYEQGYYDGYHHGYRDATSGQEYDNHWPDGYDDFEEGVHDGRHAGYDAGYREGRERYRHDRDDDPD
jgi:hypothetical protein